MIYIQSNKNIPHHFDCASAMYGAIENEQEYQLISYDQLVSGDFDKYIKQNLFVGSVEFMKEVFNRIGLSVKLPKNSNRNSEQMSLEKALKLNYKFIKPVDIKLFIVFILDKTINTQLDKINLNTEVLVYDVIENILS
jgi:hypothetical protein